MNKSHIPTFKFRLILSTFLVCLIPVSSCRDAPQDEPQEVFALFTKELKNGNAEEVWQYLDSKTQNYYREQFRKLVEMERKITQYLPSTDHEIARKKSGTVLLDEITTARELFAFTFRPGKLELTEARSLGLEVDTVHVFKPDQRAEKLTRNQKRIRAKIKTDAGQTFWLNQNSNKRWRLDLLRSLDLKQTFEWLESNYSALEQTIEQKSEQTRKRREQIISELLQPQQ